MGQLITRSTGRVEKKDTNPDYQTYGDGDAFAIDANGEYQPSDYDEVYDEVEERDGVRGTRRFTPPNVRMILQNLVNDSMILPNFVN